jgi:predicted kinase
MVWMVAILVITGASGSGKTTLLRSLEAMEIQDVVCFQCDAIYDDLPLDIRADGAVAQDAILEHWVRHALDQPAVELAVLDTQIRPQKALAILQRLGIEVYQVVLVECEQDEREARLCGPRAQPELVNAQMESWAAYLRGQADALELDRVDTSRAPISASLAWLRGIVDSLRAGKRPINRGRLIVVCGLPGSGKTTHAKALVAKIREATRFCPDDWMGAAGINLWDAAARNQIESCQWQLARGFLSQGRTVIIESGTWGRSERDTLRLGARALGASVELHYLDSPIDTLFERLRSRKLESPGISPNELRTWSETFERPAPEEIALFDSAVVVTG